MPPAGRPSTYGTPNRDSVLPPVPLRYFMPPFSPLQPDHPTCIRPPPTPFFIDPRLSSHWIFAPAPSRRPPLLTASVIRLFLLFLDDPFSLLHLRIPLLIFLPIPFMHSYLLTSVLNLPVLLVFSSSSACYPHMYLMPRGVILPTFPASFSHSHIPVSAPHYTYDWPSIRTYLLVPLSPTPTLALPLPVLRALVITLILTPHSRHPSRPTIISLRFRHLGPYLALLVLDAFFSTRTVPIRHILILLFDLVLYRRLSLAVPLFTFIVQPLIAPPVISAPPTPLLPDIATLSLEEPAAASQRFYAGGPGGAGQDRLG
ncbi:hypothetical protein R3P38DRAFT_3195322 [Favolaschia claudopus]|uniref:Uncharacterized protein n=1 Tax=Favolaschia claudopus TaxID=2862362 RepID=A0AAW0BAK5_9AGAR